MKFLPFCLLFVLAQNSLGQTTYPAFKTMLDWPVEQLLLTTLFDGLDSIYLFGVDNTTILKYSIDTDSVEHVVTFPDGAASGGAHFDLESNIIYVPGLYIGGGPVYKINLLNNSTDTVAYTDFDIFTAYFGCNHDTGNILSYSNAFFDLTPQPGNILEFNMSINLSEVVMQLEFPNKVATPVYEGNGIYHFLSRYSDCSGWPTWPCTYSNHVVSLDIKKRSYNSSSVQYDFDGNTFPKVWVEDRILILNNTVAIEVKLDQPLVRVINLSGLQIPYNSQAVYVPRLKRIYVFGGEGILGVWYFEITD